MCDPASTSSPSAPSGSDRLYSETLGCVRRSHAPSLPPFFSVWLILRHFVRNTVLIGFLRSVVEPIRRVPDNGETVKGCACSEGNGSWQHGLVCQWPTKWLIPQNTEIKSLNATMSRRARERTFVIYSNTNVWEVADSENKDMPASVCEITAVLVTDLNQ